MSAKDDHPTRPPRDISAMKPGDARFVALGTPGGRPTNMLVDKLFQWQLVHTEQFQEIEQRARQALTEMEALVGEELTRKHWPTLPRGKGAPRGPRNLVYDVLLEGRFDTLRRQRPGWSKARIIEALANETNQDSRAIEKHLRRLWRRRQ